MSEKGGPRHKPRPAVDLDAVSRAVVGHCVLHGCKFGRYDSLARSQAASGPGICENEELLGRLLVVHNTLEFAMLPLKQAFLEVVRQCPMANDTTYNNQIWASLKAERVLTMCNHLRRLAREPIRFQQASGRCTGHQLETLQRLVGMVSAEKLVEVQAALPPAPSSAKRQLQPQPSSASSISVDSEGYPRMLDVDGEPSGCKEGPVPSTNGKLAGGKGCIKKAKLDLPKAMDSKHGVFKVTYATNQSYVHLNKQFLVAISHKQASNRNHHELMHLLVKRLAKLKEVDKVVATKLRDALLLECP